jgi:tetratricopeptide (TPR) repeat protein
LKLPQVILVILALAVGAILYFTPMAPLAEKPEEVESEMPAVEYSIFDDITEIKNGLDSAALANVNRWEAEESFDSLIVFYDMLRKPVGSAFFAQKNAEKNNSADSWTEVGERFLLNAKYMGTQPQRTSWFAQSKAAFEKAVELAPEDLDIKVDLGVCMIEGASFLGTPPMQGIGILKSVEQQDPNNIKALVNLGYFSIKSGQYDKAQERFHQVLKIDPEFADAHLYLADLHEKQKDFAAAIKDLENYRSLIQDEARIEEVNKYIEELSNNI